MITAVVDVAVGNVTVKLPDAVLSDPKSKTHTAAFVLPLYINAALVVKLADAHVTLLKET
jgi:hypothetical protein